MSAHTQVYTIYGVGLFLSTAFVAQRVYTKLRILGSFAVEDWLLSVAFLLSIGTQAVGLHLFVDHIAGSRRTEVYQWQREEFAISSALAPIIYAPATCLARLSLLFFYLKITPQLWFLRTTKILIWVVTAYTIAITLSNLFACRPIRAAWDINIVDKQCINRSALYIVTAVLNITTDITMLVLPIPVVMPLQMSKRQKVEVLGIFALGSLTFITSIVRLAYLLAMISATDVIWQATWPISWIGIEANLQVICAAAPTLRKFLRTTMPRFFDTDPGRETRRLGSLGLRTFGQGTTTIVTTTAAAAAAKTRRPHLHVRASDDIEAILVAHEEDLEAQRLSVCSRPETAPGPRLVHVSRYHVPADVPKIASPLSDAGSERAMLHLPPMYEPARAVPA